MAILRFGQELRMDKDQIIELRRSLSPHLTGAIPGQELRKDEHTDEEKSGRDSEYTRVDPIESHLEEGSV
jgi:hypothetical protein